MREKFPCIIHGHSTTWHDGAVAILFPNGNICAIAAERVGDRVKHDWDSRVAYEYLKNKFPNYKSCFGGKRDLFSNPGEDDLLKARHHLNHASSAFHGSSYDNSAVLVVDGQGPEEGSLIATSIWDAQGRDLRFVETFHKTQGKFLPESPGHFYTAIGALAGMQNLHEEGKTMGLAAYGKPSQFLECFRQYVYTKDDGSYHISPAFVYAVLGNTLGPRIFGWGTQPPHVQSIWNEIMSLRSSPPRTSGQDVTQDDMDIAFAGQVILEEILLGLVKRAKEQTSRQNLCLAGGVFLNCVANKTIVESQIFKGVFIFPASDDSGQAIGKLYQHIHREGIHIDTRLKTAYLGPRYNDEEMRMAINNGSGFSVVSQRMDSTIGSAAVALAQGKVIGWFQGRSEIGPRALGNRSILADPRRKDMLARINGQIKYREWFRPVAPSVVAEEAHRYFTASFPSPFMLIATTIRPEARKHIPAVVHTDGTARFHTVQYVDNPRFYRLLKMFGNITGVPVLVNTSFNAKDEPMVESPDDAVTSFCEMNLDGLVLGRYFLVKH